MCQVTDLRLLKYLPCKFEEGGGRQCEREEAHGDEIPHFWSMHTIMHERAGNGYACEAIGHPVALFAERQRAKEELRQAEEYVAKLDSMPSVP